MKFLKYIGKLPIVCCLLNIFAFQNIESQQPDFAFTSVLVTSKVLVTSNSPDLITLNSPDLITFVNTFLGDCHNQNISGAAPNAEANPLQLIRWLYDYRTAQPIMNKALTAAVYRSKNPGHCSMCAITFIYDGGNCQYNYRTGLLNGFFISGSRGKTPDGYQRDQLENIQIFNQTNINNCYYFPEHESFCHSERAIVALLVNMNWNDFQYIEIQNFKLPICCIIVHIKNMLRPCDNCANMFAEIFRMTDNGVPIVLDIGYESIYDHCCQSSFETHFFA